MITVYPRTYKCNDCGHEFSGVEHSGGGVCYTPPPAYFFNPCPKCKSNHTYPKGLFERIGFGAFISQGQRDKWKEWDKKGPDAWENIGHVGEE